MNDFIEDTRQRILSAARQGKALRPRGGGSKDFHACALAGDMLDLTPWRGVVNYDPTELVISVRAGTPLAEVEAVLAERNQFLACEPPRLAPGTTLGGCVAAGWSGPRRPYAGSVRDFVLGARVLNGRGEDLRFGGEVMKNVAGFDLSRLLAGSFGTLGVILEVSLKVLPRPARELTLRFEMTQARAIEAMNQWAGQPHPLSATAWSDGVLHVRLSGVAPAVDSARVRLGGEPLHDAEAFWGGLRDQTAPPMRGDLWRLSIKPTTPPLDLPGTTLLEWNGAQRWLATDADPGSVHAAARQSGGQALRYRGGSGGPLFEADAATLRIHQRLKRALDPDNVFSPGRLHPGF